MNYTKFKNKVSNRPIIYSRDLTMHGCNKQIMRNQLNRWQAKGLLIKLKRGIFLLNQNDRKVMPSRVFIANQLYKPSYVSLEYALNYYGIIPERVNVLTCVSTRKTSSISNELGEFTYQHFKPKAFRGFKALKDEAGLVFFIAEAEKALVDFCYFNLKNFQDNFKTVFIESYRFQNLETLKAKKIMYFSKIFDSNKLNKVCKSLCELIREEK